MAQEHIIEWIKKNDKNKFFRQAVHVIVYAVSDEKDLKDMVIMKGGILMALDYMSTRFTRDVDFSTDKKLSEFDVESFVKKFEQSLLNAVNKLGYGIDCVVQGWRQEPPKIDATFPTVQIRVGYADRNDDRAHRLLIRKKANHVVKVDVSLNEPRGRPELFEIGEGRSVQVYSFHDLVAEKFRAILQQEKKNRFRRQDVYDLYVLLSNIDSELCEGRKMDVLVSLKEKAASRDVVVEKMSMRNPEIVRRSREQYFLLKTEIEGPLPDFDKAYEFVRAYYESLPWN